MELIIGSMLSVALKKKIKKTDGSLHTPEDITWYSLLIAAHETFFTRESMCFRDMDCLFGTDSKWQTYVELICWFFFFFFFFLLKHASPYTSYSVNV